MDGTGLKLLTPDSANHRINLSPDGNCFVDNYSTPQIPPITDLRDMEGTKLVHLEKLTSILRRNIPLSTTSTLGLNREV